MNYIHTQEQLQLPSDQDASGRQLGKEEIALLAEAIESGTLTSTKGRFVKSFQSAFADLVGSRHGFACGSGTGAIHAAIAAIDPEPGDEIITSPITDMGAITPIIYQTAVPVFADVDPVTGNVTAETIARMIGPKTKAIVVTHLFGNPAEIGPIMELSRRHGIPVIEDCAQAYGTIYDGKHAGTIGAIGCFSLQQGKHITTGEGGIVVTDDEHLARRMRLFIDKAWGYGDPKPDHYFVALNGRMTELQGAVAVAQLGKLEHSISRRRDIAGILTGALAGLGGIRLIPVPKAGTHAYWKFALHVDPECDGPDGLARKLRESNIPSAPRYIQKPAFECEVIRDRKTFGKSGFPFTLAREEVLSYGRDRYPGTYEFLSTVLVLGWNERLEQQHVEQIASHIAAHVGKS
jgi:perosamine synthetase